MTSWGESMVSMMYQKLRWSSQVKKSTFLVKSPLSMFYHLESDIGEDGNMVLGLFLKGFGLE